MFFGTVDWRSDNCFSVLFFARPPFKANSHLRSSQDSSEQLQDFARILFLELFPLDWDEVGVTLYLLTRITLCPRDALSLL